MLNQEILFRLISAQVLAALKGGELKDQGCIYVSIRRVWLDRGGNTSFIGFGVNSHCVTNEQTDSY